MAGSNPTSFPLLVDFREASKLLGGISIYTLRAWARRGLLRTICCGRRRLVPVEECTRIAREGVRTRD